MKKKFVPDIIFIDYLNICSSSRIKGAAAANSYTLVKSIAEEVRGLAMEYGVPIVSSSQLNRDGYNNSDVDLTNTSESMGLTHTADAIFALMASEELDSLNQIMVKQLKNRWGDINTHRRFVIGMDKARMKLYNTEGSSQTHIFKGENDKSDKADTPVMDTENVFEQEWSNRSSGSKKLFNVGEFA
jgi:predicted ATP-dependent serine protease